MRSVAQFKVGLASFAAGALAVSSMGVAMANGIGFGDTFNNALSNDNHAVAHPTDDGANAALDTSAASDTYGTVDAGGYDDNAALDVDNDTSADAYGTVNVEQGSDDYGSLMVDGAAMAQQEANGYVEYSDEDGVSTHLDNDVNGSADAAVEYVNDHDAEDYVPTLEYDAGADVESATSANASADQDAGLVDLSGDGEAQSVLGLDLGL